MKPTATAGIAQLIDKDNSDEDGNAVKTVSVTKSVDSKGNVTVTLKDRKNGTATGTTDKNGMLTLPATEHKAYIVGYDDGTFKPDSNMSRAEAALSLQDLLLKQKAESSPKGLLFCLLCSIMYS